jgi:hypothetical protein
MGTDEIRRHDLVRIEAFEQAANEGGLARADFAGDDDEAFAPVQNRIRGRAAPAGASGCRKGTTDQG